MCTLQKTSHFPDIILLSLFLSLSFCCMCRVTELTGLDIRLFVTRVDIISTPLQILLSFPSLSQGNLTLCFCSWCVLSLEKDVARRSSFVKVIVLLMSSTYGQMSTQMLKLHPFLRKTKESCKYGIKYHFGTFVVLRILSELTVKGYPKN